ncbi:MAG: alpha/beta hydrolase [Actinomycetota bacterium]
MEVEPIQHLVRPATGDPEGALVLHHGRGAGARDLYPLLDILDPERRLIGLCPQGPLALPPGGAHWYAVHRVGYPDPQTFWPTFGRLKEWFDSIEGEYGIGIGRTLVGGFSQGAVMSYAISLTAGRSQPAGLLCFSGFIPRVDGLDIELSGRAGLPVAIGHGTQDPVIGVEFGRAAKTELEAAGCDVVYRESPMGHSIDPGWLKTLVPRVAGIVDGFSASGEPAVGG